MSKRPTITISRALAERCAAALEEEADIVKQSATVNGCWEIMTPADAAIRRVYDRLMRCASGMRKALKAQRGEAKGR